MTIRIFVGTGANGEDAESCMVLDYTIRKHCSQPVDILWMTLSRDPASFWSGWDSSQWATPFSGFRWGIPHFCGYQGKALYLDSDMIVQRDLAELWDTPFQPGKIVQAKGGWRYCVTLFDCAAAKDEFYDLDVLKSEAGHKMQTAYLKQNPQLTQVFDPRWNYCDIEDYGPLDEALIVHYTDMSTQPHLKYAIPRLAEAGHEHWFDGLTRDHPRQEIDALFDREYEAALAAGFKVQDYVPRIRYGSYKKKSLVGYRR